MFCNNCGKPLDENATFCSECGQQIDSGAKMEKTESLNIDNANQLCNQCGASLESSSTFCGQCGAVADNSTSAVSNIDTVKLHEKSYKIPPHAHIQAKKKENLVPLLVALATVIVLSAAAICYFLFFNGGTDIKANVISTEDILKPTQTAIPENSNAQLETPTPTATVPPVVNTTPAPTIDAVNNNSQQLVGTWRRDNPSSDLDGTVVRLEYSQTSYRGVITEINNSAASSLGFTVGDTKWDNIRQESNNSWRISDLRKGSSGSSRQDMFMWFDESNSNILYMGSTTNTNTQGDRQKWVRIQ